MSSRSVAYPYLFWMVIFIVVPLLLILYYAFTVPVDGGVALSLDNFAKLASKNYITVIFKSLGIAALTSLFCLLLGYPVSYFLSKSKLKNKGFIVFLFIIPMWMNSLIRTYAWVSILEKNGLLNAILGFLHLPEVNILYTDSAVILGMVYNFLPFMILPIYNVLTNMDAHLIEAAQDLGANGVTVFRRVIFPLSLPGVFSGITMTFMPSVTAFLISNLLGGGQNVLIGNLIERQFLNYGDWHLGSAISALLMVVILMSMAAVNVMERRNAGGTQK